MTEERWAKVAEVAFAVAAVAFTVSLLAILYGVASGGS
jgi:hypothetical protein